MEAERRLGVGRQNSLEGASIQGRVGLLNENLHRTERQPTIRGQPMQFDIRWRTLEMERLLHGT